VAAAVDILPAVQQQLLSAEWQLYYRYFTERDLVESLHAGPSRTG
jgi:hypothetical protein